MNKIFKVIWSKSKQCYVVVSEMAKNKTGKKKIVVASILAALAMQVGVVADVSAADRPTGTIEGGTKMYSNLTNGLAIGNESQSNSNQSIAIGYRAVANSQYADPAQPAVAIGAGASATGRGGVSLGLIANSSVRGTAIGSATTATGFGAFAGGTYAQATNAGDVAIGGASSDQFNNYAVASGGYSVAIGTGAKADGGAGVSIGYKTNAKTSNSLAIGSESVATGEGGVAVGRKNTSTGASSTVLGILSTANATSATAVGMQTTATGENSLAVGHKSSASGKNGVAVGTNGTTAVLGGVAVGQAAKSNKFNSVGMGMNVTADGDNSVALGANASANSDGTIAIGSYGPTPTTATGNRALAIGSATTANGLESIAIGSRVNSTSQHSIAIGTGSTASAVKSVAIGPDSRATVDGGVALGRDSVASVEGGVTNKGYNPNTNRTDVYSGLNGNVLTSTTGAVSIGNGSTVTRQLTGLAAGIRDTDAVNVAQLKSVNLAFSGNVNTGNVNIANSTLGLKGDNTYITTAANGQNLIISGKTQNINVTNGQASANAAGMADSKNVADAINKAISANAYQWKLAADRDPSAPEVINKSDTVIFGGDNNITVTRSGKKITTSLNKAITVDTVKANRSVTVSSGGNQITLDGTNGSVKGRNFTGDSFKAGDNVLSNTTLQIGPTTGSNNVTITRDGLTAKTATKTVKFGTDGISAGGQQITNVSSGGNVGTNAANITDVKNAVSDVTLKLDTNSKTGTVKLSESPLKVIGANGIRTDLVGTNNGSLVVGLDNNTVNATTKGIGLTGDTGSTGLKYLKDGDATFKVAGDGNLVTTKASATGVQVAVDAAKVKDLAVGAVTVSKANTADNPITITPTAGTNTKDYAIGIDTTKLANQTQLTYKANGANANKVSLANGLNFINGNFTTATVGANGNVTISTATEMITNDADGKAKVNSPTDGLATAKNVADSINKAVDGLSQNLTVSDGTTDGTVNLKNQKLTVSGTNGVTATVNGQTVTVGLDAATKSKVDNASTAVNRNISLGADSGTPSSQSLKDGNVAFNVKGATGDFVSTKMNGDTVEVSTKRATIDSNATTGAASVTGDDGLATAKNVADAINKAADKAKDGAAWNVSANGDAGTKVSGGDTVDFTGDNNITVTQTGKNIATTLNKDLKKLNSISLENGNGETIKFDAINASGKFSDPAVGNYTQIDRDGIRINNGIDINQPNTANTYLDVGSLSLQAGPNSSSLDSKTLIFNDEDGNLAQGSAQGMAFRSATGKEVQFTLDEIKAGGNKIKEVAEGTADTDAVNVKQLKDTVASQTLTYRANTAADTDAKTVKLSKGLDFVDGTMTKATVDNDGKVTFDINDDTKTKINDSATAVNRKVSLGADSGTPSSQSLKDGDVAFNVKGATGDFVSTKMNGDTVEVSTKRATIDSNATTGAASVTGDDGLATAKNVADAINKAANQAKAGAAWNLTTNSSTTDKTSVQGGDTVDLINGDNILITQDGTDKKKITVATKKDLTVDSVTAGNTVINTSGLTNGTTAITGSGITTDKVTVGGISVDKTDGINAGGKIITNVASGGTTDTNAANIGDVKQAVANLSQNLNITDGTNDGTIDLKNQKLNVAGTNGVTATVKDQTITVGLDTDTKTKIDDSAAAVNRKVSLGADSGTPSSQSLKDGDVAFNVKGATGDFLSTKMNGDTVEVSTKRATIDSNATTGAASVTGDDGLATAKNVADAINKAAKASSDAVNLKFSGDTNTSAGVVNLKDDTLGIKGDGKYVTTDADGKNLTVKVSEEEVKKSAVGAVTVSTDTTDADNPLTVTGTTSADGTTKDYKVTIDGTKVAAKTNLSYKANDGTAKQVSLADGLNFKNGNMTTASIDNAGVVKYDVNTETITAGTDGTITGPATDGVATAKNVADAINAAKKSSKTEITANDGEAADGTTGNVVLTSSKAADGHTIYDVKLNDKVTLGTGANAVTVDGTTGTITGKSANIGSVTVDGTNNHVTGLSNTTWDGNAVSGRAATEDQLKAVADAAASQTWQITADKDAATSGIQTGTKTDAKVGKDAKVTMIAGENITINQNERDFTYSLNKDLVNMNSASFNGTGNNTTVINGDSITQTAGTQTNTSTAAGNTVADGAKSTATTAAGTTITDGTKTNTSTADSTVIDDGNGNNTALTKDGITITTAGKDKVSLTGNGLDNGNNKIVNVADGTNDTDAVNVRQLEAKTKASTTELTANGGESAGSTTGNIVLTKTTAADGHIIYDNKLNDKLTLGNDPTKAVTVDGTTGTIKAGKDGNAVAINGTDGTIKAGDGTNAVAIDGKNGSVKAGDKIALDGKDGKATIGTVGIDGKDGVISGLANKTWDPNNITPGRAATEDQVKSAVADAGWDAAVGTEGSGVNSTPNATAEKVKPNETLTFKAGNNMIVSQNGKSISYAVNPELKDMKSATFKDADGNTTVTNGNGMTITPGSANPNNPNAGPVSLTKDGLNNGNNQLKGIAPGTDDTDAVNVGQLKASNAKIGDAIGQVAGEVQRAGAHAAAMAALKPIQYDPLEPTQVMAGVGNYRGETAAALGLAHYTNEDTMFNVGVSLGANRNMVNAGVTHKFGSSPEKKNIPDRYKAGPISSVYVMQDEVSSLKKENSEQKTVIADQAARLNTLEAENERQRQELAETKQGLEDLRAAVSQLLASKG